MSELYYANLPEVDRPHSVGNPCAPQFDGL